MSEEQGAGGTQAAPSASPQAGTAEAPVAGQQPQAGAGTPQAMDAETLQRELAAARREAAGYRTKLKGFEDRDKTESEKQVERIRELEASLDTQQGIQMESRLEIAAYAAARKLGYRSPEIAYRLIAPVEVDFDDDGKPTNVADLLADIAKREPYLTTGGSGDAGLGPRGSQPGNGIGMNDIIRKAAGRI